MNTRSSFSSLLVWGGSVLLVLSAAGILLAGGHLLSLKPIQESLEEAIPEAREAVAGAVAQSRLRSVYGLVVCGGTLVLGGVLVHSGKKRRSPGARPMR